MIFNSKIVVRYICDWYIINELDFEYMYYEWPDTWISLWPVYDGSIIGILKFHRRRMKLDFHTTNKWGSIQQKYSRVKVWNAILSLYTLFLLALGNSCTCTCKSTLNVTLFWEMSKGQYSSMNCDKERSPTILHRGGGGGGGGLYNNHNCFGNWVRNYRVNISFWTCIEGGGGGVNIMRVGVCITIITVLGIE